MLQTTNQLLINISGHPGLFLNVCLIVCDQDRSEPRFAVEDNLLSPRLVLLKFRACGEGIEQI